MEKRISTLSEEAFDCAINEAKERIAGKRIFPEGQTQFRFCATGTAVADGSTILGTPTDCNQSTIDYLLSLPQYKNHWYEIRGGVFGKDWVKVSDIIQDASAPE